MKQNLTPRSLFRKLRRDERGIVVVLVTLWLPVIVGFFTLATDMAYVHWTRNHLQVIAEAAALAATSSLPNISPCNIPDSPCDLAIKYVNKQNLPASYGTVLNTTASPDGSSPTGDVVLGKWTDGCIGGGESAASCFAPLPNGTTCITFGCNGVKVTTRRAAANGNALKLTFAPMIGIGNFDVSATAIAVYGMGQINGAAPFWDVIIVQDVTGSLSQDSLTKMKQANRVLLDCMHNNASQGSKLGISLFTGCSGSTCPTPLPIYQEQASVTATAVNDMGNYDTLKTSIGDPPTNIMNGLKKCGEKNAANVTMPQCSGTNPSSGMASAFSQFCREIPCPAGPGGSRKAMVIVSDGLPEDNPINKCGGQTCTVQQLKDRAVAQANAAADQNIDIYTLYYGSDAAGATWLATLRRGNGIAMTTPDPNKLPELMGKVCASMPHRLVW